MKKKIYKYYTSLSYKGLDGNITNVITQLYQIGVYIIFNNDPLLQANITPANMASTEKKIQKAFDSGEITDLEWGREIKVIEENGYWVELKE